MTSRASKLTKRAKRTGSDGAQEITIPANTIRVFINALQRLGYSTDELMASAGVSTSDLADPDGRLPCLTVGEILGAAMRQKSLKNLAACMAAETPIGAFELVDYLVLTSATVKAAIHQLARYLRLTEAPYILTVREDENPIRVLFEKTLNAFTAEFGVVLTLRHLRNEAEGDLLADSVSYSHSPDDPSGIAALVGCPVYPNASWNGFSLSREMWDMPMRRRDPILRDLLERNAPEVTDTISNTSTVERDVRDLLVARMAEGLTDLAAVARELSMSSRSVQRRLAAGGLSYQQVLDRVRLDAARQYLADPKLSTGEVAYLLGYSEPAAFHRAFKRWHGMTPSAFRTRRKNVAVQ